MIAVLLQSPRPKDEPKARNTLKSAVSAESGDVARRLKVDSKIGDVARRAKSGNVARSRTKSGDVARSIAKSGDVDRSPAKSSGVAGLDESKEFVGWLVHGGKALKCGVIGW